jgi:hypothetical protein
LGVQSRFVVGLGGGLWRGVRIGAAVHCFLGLDGGRRWEDEEVCVDLEAELEGEGEEG